MGKCKRRNRTRLNPLSKWNVIKTLTLYLEAFMKQSETKWGSHHGPCYRLLVPVDHKQVAVEVGNMRITFNQPKPKRRACSLLHTD